jgi:hypothetical protein
MNAYGGIENMHNNYATWTSMFSHVHEIKNRSLMVVLSPSNSGLLVDGGWLSPAISKLFYLNKKIFKK